MDAGTMTAAATAVVDAVTGSAMPLTAAPAPGMTELFGGVIQVVKDFQTAGWMVGMVTLTGLLSMVLRIPFVDALFKKAPAWVRPVVIAGIGALGGFFQGLPNGLMPALVAAVSGIGAGFAAIGGHTLLSRLTPAGAAEVNVGRAMSALAKADTDATEKAEAMKTAIDKAVSLPAGRERLRALAILANGKAKP